MSQESIPELEVPDHISTIHYSGGSIKSKVSILTIIHVVLQGHGTIVKLKNDQINSTNLVKQKGHSA